MIKTCYDWHLILAIKELVPLGSQSLLSGGCLSSRPETWYVRSHKFFAHKLVF